MRDMPMAGERNYIGPRGAELYNASAAARAPAVYFIRYRGHHPHRPIPSIMRFYDWNLAASKKSSFITTGITAGGPSVRLPFPAPFPQICNYIGESRIREDAENTKVDSAAEAEMIPALIPRRSRAERLWLNFAFGLLVTQGLPPSLRENK